MTDGLFNIPGEALGFIYVHDIQIVNYTDEDLQVQESDADGIPVPIVKEEIPTIKGYVALPNPRQAGRTQRMDAVCRVPHGTVVDELQSMLVVLDEQPAGIMPGLTGTYKVFQVRPNPADIRLLLKRPKLDKQDKDVQPFEDDPYGE